MARWLGVFSNRMVAIFLTEKRRKSAQVYICLTQKETLIYKLFLFEFGEMSNWSKQRKKKKKKKETQQEWLTRKSMHELSELSWISAGKSLPRN